MDKKETGELGEQKANNYLLKEGYEILERNFRYKHSEIDLICLKDNLLIFIEVKTLKNEKFQFPEEKVNQQKINKILEGADAYIHAINWQKDIRFDIISISLSAEDKIIHIKDAFY